MYANASLCVGVCVARGKMINSVIQQDGMSNLCLLFSFSFLIPGGVVCDLWYFKYYLSFSCAVSMWFCTFVCMQWRANAHCLGSVQRLMCRCIDLVLFVDANEIHNHLRNNNLCLLCWLSGTRVVCLLYVPHMEVWERKDQIQFGYIKKEGEREVVLCNFFLSFSLPHTCRKWVWIT